MHIRTFLLLCGAIGMCSCDLRGEPGLESKIPAPVKIVLEAESGKVVAPFVVAEEKGASKGKVVAVSQKADWQLPRTPRKKGDFWPGLVTLKFRVRVEGDYILWGRVWWQTAMGNSVLVTLDEGVTKQDALVLGEDGTLQRYHWVWFRKPIHLTKGKHILRIHNRGQDGIKTDQIALIQCERPFRRGHQYVPIGILKQ